jgi:hypothetical protein
MPISPDTHSKIGINIRFRQYTASGSHAWRKAQWKFLQSSRVPQIRVHTQVGHEVRQLCAFVQAREIRGRPVGVKETPNQNLPLRVDSIRF